LQALAEPGGVVVSDDAHRQVRGKLQFGFEDMGEHEVKNILDPVRAFRVRPRHGTTELSRPAPAASLPLPDKPSIAVLPFVNMSGDPDQEYFADGLAEDIITTLSKVSGLFVIARNSTFSYKGRSPDVRQVARELGVRNVLEGSVRKSGDRVRITAQLIDATSGSHLWAERYDRKLIDIFDLQDEITNEVATALEVRLTEGEQVRLRRRQTNDIAAWEYYARGQSHLRRFNKQDNAKAQELLHQSVELDPDFASAWSLLAWIHYMDGRFGWSRSIAESMERAATCVARSLELDDTQPDAHALKGTVCLHQRQYDEAVQAGRTAVDLGPNVADSYLLLAHTLNYAGCAEDALRIVEQAMRLSPFFPDWYLGVAALSYRLLGRYEDSIAADKERLARNPDNTFSDFRLAAVYEELGRHEEARAHIAEALKRNPQLSLAQIRVSEPYRDEAELERYIDLLRKAGLPE
jgi:adenylate cyclase